MGDNICSFFGCMCVRVDNKPMYMSIQPTDLYNALDERLYFFIEP